MLCLIILTFWSRTFQSWRASTWSIGGTRQIHGRAGMNICALKRVWLLAKVTIWFYYTNALLATFHCLAESQPDIRLHLLLNMQLALSVLIFHQLKMRIQETEIVKTQQPKKRLRIATFSNLLSNVWTMHWRTANLWLKR